MAGRGEQSDSAASPHIKGARILIIEARYYESISDLLVEGALAEINAAGAAYARVIVPGALEIPLALGQAAAAGIIPAGRPRAQFDGAIALGCVIRGETTHYETVCDNANHWLMQIATRYAIPLGNAILTVENEAQAVARAEGGRKGKGADAVRACLSLIGHARAFAGTAR